MIRIDGLHKAFGHVAAVRGISLDVNPGEVLGFLGPNGAGKSTTMKMITGFLLPDRGTVTVFGDDVIAAPEAAKKRIGYLPEGAPAWGEMTVAAFLRFIAGVRGYRGIECEERVARVLRELELGDVRDRTIDTLSKGFKRRVGLAQAILHDPQVLVLDEPTDGLDPNQKHQVRELIKRLSPGRIIIISTHILEEVTAVCTRAVVIADGAVVADGTPAELEAQSRYHGALTATLDAGADVDDALVQLPGVLAVEADPADPARRTLVPHGPADLLPGFLALARERNWTVRDLVIERGRLDEVFRRLTRDRAA
ncbi:MAG: ABC transporter ATP-binding protein [Gammaproteobacteria bacterium]